MRQSYWKACSQNAESLLELAYLSESHIHHRANHAWKIYMGCSERGESPSFTHVCIVICEVGWRVWLNPSVGNKESPWREETNVEQILGNCTWKALFNDFLPVPSLQSVLLWRPAAGSRRRRRLNEHKSGWREIIVDCSLPQRCASPIEDNNCTSHKLSAPCAHM